MALQLGEDFSDFTKSRWSIELVVFHNVVIISRASGMIS